ncbi:endolytic transglycosylase MltG [Flavobacterium azooxidireducens]|uniref:Endolytic murein transglycosylase n=1 Tax=Flavobacterium azooxidireducens TaxID=1871076 RepID=A0ABY4KIJ2_9FLAO|nr:endolytic transglycosylase MltG [Flavobacterium azooxidireducens]UPQ79252.1 endolytic transglycosylase MltG [Flavobacterium azooxidireducens]
MNFKKIILYISLVILLVVAYFGFKVYQIVFTPNTSFSEEKVTVFVPTNANFEEVKAIVSPYLKDMDKFETLANRRGYSTEVKAGKFELTKNMNTNSIVSALRRSVPVRVTFNNQERLENFAGRISSQIEADSIQLLQAFKNPKFLEENGFTEETVFTLLLPNTFEFYWDTSAEKFRNQMAKEYFRFWNDERKAKAEKLGLTPIEVSILASIVHKETAKVEERPRVAKVYLNRMNIGMPLQADPTVIYAYKLVANDFNQVIKRVYYKHLEVESPYNTYRNAGLPPGPIFMADVNAIDAVLNPEQHDFIYFCASVERFGYHEFATTLEQHNVNARKYAAWLNAQTSGN